MTSLARHGTKAQSGPDAAAPSPLSGGCGSRLSGGRQAGPPSLFTEERWGLSRQLGSLLSVRPTAVSPQTRNSTGSLKGTRREQ